MLRSAATIPGSGTGTYHHHDGLGNVVALSFSFAIASPDDNSRKSRKAGFGKRTVYNATGQQIPDTAYANTHGYTGREHLPLRCLMDYRNRSYSTSLGRFLQTDPIRFDAGDVNLYRYVLNNPINMWDPFGLWSLYRFIYTGDGNASDDVYNAAVDAAGEYLYSKSGVRGVTVGVRFNFPSKNTVRGQVSAGVSATIDNGLGAQVGAGINVKTGKGTNMTFGGGYAWNQREGGGVAEALVVKGFAALKVLATVNLAEQC